jgi:hypothetical protein
VRNRELARVGGANSRRHADCLWGTEGRFLLRARASRAVGKAGLEVAMGRPVVGSGGAAVAVVQEAAKTLAAFNLARGPVGEPAGARILHDVNKSTLVMQSTVDTSLSRSTERTLMQHSAVWSRSYTSSFRKLF